LCPKGRRPGEKEKHRRPSTEKKWGIGVDWWKRIVKEN
jgi:hypothetical protein